MTDWKYSYSVQADVASGDGDYPWRRLLNAIEASLMPLERWVACLLSLVKPRSNFRN